MIPGLVEVLETVERVELAAWIDPLEPLRVYQGGLCGLCEEARPLIVDHDHVTMLVRGLLCFRCNTSEGASDYPWLRAYRANPPAAQIGLKVLYGQHKPRPISRPDKLGPLTYFARVATWAAEHPDWSPTLPADPDQAGMLAEFWRVLRAFGDTVKVLEAEARALDTPARISTPVE